MNKTDFLAAVVRKPEYKPIELEGVGTVFIKRLTAGEKDAYERANVGNNVNRAVVLCHFLFDDRGERIFSDDDMLALSQSDPMTIDHIVVEALKFNSYTKEEQDQLLKNSNGQAATS